MSDTRAPGRASERFEERRRELADAALQTLSELGYARTSLREIAQHSAYSHGVLHYYFVDKNELITYCVRRYKTHCAERYDELVSAARTAADLASGFPAALVASLRDDALMHRLWYDVRSQALFDDTFRLDVLDIDGLLEQMIGRVVTRYAELVPDATPVSPAAAYAALDGLFQYALLRHLAGHPSAADDLYRDAAALLPRLVTLG